MPDAPASARIKAITLTEREAGGEDVLLEFIGEAWQGPRSFAGVSRAIDDCPFFVPYGDNALGKSMAFRDEYTQIHARNETEDKIAWLEANVTTDAYVYLFATNSGDPENFCEITLGGEGTLELKGGRAIELTVSNGDEYKHHLIGGSGLVFPVLSADPATDAQEAQVYYNSASQVLRLYDGTSWTDVAGGSGAPALDYIVDDDDTLPTPGVRFAGTFGGDDATYIGAKAIDAGVGSDYDSVLDLRAESGNTNLDLFAYDNDTSGSVDIFADGSAGELYVTVTGIVDITAPGGLVVPRLGSDPASPVDGTIWYRTDIDKLRLRANGSTVDLN